jgi:ADP-ribose pyrophosphatase YjhB (NUDIX family)
MPPFVSASAIVLDEDRVLVVHDPIRREPVLPGGHVKWREDPRAAVVREVCEETGYTIEAGGVLAVLSGKEWTGEPGVVRIVYTATVRGGRLSSSPEGEAAWMPLECLRASGNRDASVVQLYLEGRPQSGGGL